MNRPSLPDAADIRQVIRSIEKATGMGFCLKIFDSKSREGNMLGRLPRNYRLHSSAFCLEVKRTRTALCKECDLRRVPVLCERKRTCFIHTCHAGACEVIVPVFVHERLVAVAYLGQFRSKKEPGELPFLTPEERRNLLGIAAMTGSYLAEQIRTPRFARETSQGFRKESIHRFLTMHLGKNPSLPELAAHLGLSVTRTAHAVREATGVSFVETRDKIRLERACSLLRETYYKVAHVAAECGFSSPQYFHRFFRKQTGFTPLAFRRQRRLEI